MRYVLLCMVLLGTVPVLADYQVSNLADAGPGSLRQAILDANAAGGGRIDCQNISGSIVLEEPLPRFSANIQIEGPGAESLTISGSGKTTVFSMEAGTTNSVSGLTVAEGAAESLWQGEETVVPGRGAGIFNEGSLVLIACEVRDCIVLGERSAEGVGIYNTGDLVLRGCKVTRCGTLEPVPTVTRVYGGGIANRGSLQLVGSELDHCGGSHGGTVFNAGIMTAVQCAFSGGRALSPGHAGGILSLGDLILVSSTVSNCVGSWGGGVSSGGMFWATNSTFAGNYAEDYGGGLLLTGTNVLSGCSVVGNSSFWGGGVLNGGDTELINCTLSGNTGSQGAGVLNDWFLGNAKLHLNHCTVSFNRRDLEFFPGGGVDIKEGIGSAWNTLLAGNEGGDWVGVLESGGCNLVQDASQCSFTGNLTANLVGADPLLGPLGYHGGATPTHGFLSPSSPAIDAAGAGGLRTDQRGFARTCRSHPGGSPGADIGSYELARLEPVAAGWLDTGGEALGIELRGHLAFIANGPAGLLVCDVRDAANPQVLARVEPCGVAEDIQLAGKWAFVAQGQAGLGIYDISRPDAPVKKANVRTGGYARRVTVAGRRLFVATQTNGLIIYDISKPARPVRLSRFRPGRCSTWDVAVQGRTAYLANGKQGIWVLDTSRAGNVRVLDRINIGGELRELELKENLLYAAAAPAGVQVFDVCHPDHPRLADLVPTAGTPHALHFVGEFGFIADCSFGLSVFNLPSAEVVGHAYSAGSASDVAVAGRYLYLANGADGLRIYQWHGQGASLTGARSGVRDFVLRATVAPGQTYTVQASSDLEAWVDIGEVTADAEGCCEYVDPLAGTASSRFYKLKLP